LPTMGRSIELLENLRMKVRTQPGFVKNIRVFSKVCQEVSTKV